MTHGDCASAGQCRLDRVEKSNGAVGVIAKYKLMLFFFFTFSFAGGGIYSGDTTVFLLSTLICRTLAFSVSMVWKWGKSAFYLLTFKMETLVWIQRSSVDADLK